MTTANPQQATQTVAETPARKRPGRADVAAGALLLLHAVLCWSSRLAAPLTRQDDAIYLLLARSFRQGTGFSDIFLAEPVAHTLYPPGYALLLAAWSLPFGSSYTAAVLMSVVASTGALAIMYVAVRRLFSTTVALAALVALVANPFLVEFGGDVASEAMYTLFSMGALFLLLPRPEPGNVRRGFAAGLAVASAMVRVVGLAAVIAVAGALALRRKGRALVVYGIVTATAVGGWIYWSAQAPELYVGRSYLAEAVATGTDGNTVPTAMVHRVIDRVPYQLGDALPYIYAVPSVPGTPIDNAFIALTVAIGLIGGLLILLRRWRPAAIYVAVYLGVLMVWVWRDDRFAIPLLPLLIPGLLLSFHALTDRFGPVVRRGVVWGLAGVLAVTGGLRTAELLGGRGSCTVVDGYPNGDCMRLDQRSYFEALRWIEANTPPDAIIYTGKQEPLYWYTGRRTTSFRRSLAVPESEFIADLEAQGVDYILLASLKALEPSRLADRLEQHCARLRPEAFFPARTYIFTIRPEPAAAESSGCAAIGEYRVANEGRDFARDP